MKKLITTALLFAGLTISAQEGPITDLYEKFETIDSVYEDGVYFTSKMLSGFINQNDTEDTLFVWLVVKYDVDYNVKVIALGFQTINNYDYDDLRVIQFELADKTVNFKLSKELLNPLDFTWYLTTDEKLTIEEFVVPIKSIKIRHKTYIPDKYHEVFFQYHLLSFNYLKFDWTK
jgi:hypothetical protein